MIVQAADGRQLEALTSGPPDGLAVVLHNGTPAGLVAAPAIAAVAAERGMRLVLYARPGYESSTPDPGRRVSAAAADLAAVLDGLGAGQFVTVGWSGGGPHALACAALLPGRCLAAATMAGVAPNHAEGLDWVAGMGAENVAEFSAAQAGAEALTSFLEPAAREMAAMTADDVAAGLPAKQRRRDAVQERLRLASHRRRAALQQVQYRGRDGRVPLAQADAKLGAVERGMEAQATAGAAMPFRCATSATMSRTIRLRSQSFGV